MSQQLILPDQKERQTSKNLKFRSKGLPHVSTRPAIIFFAGDALKQQTQSASKYVSEVLQNQGTTGKYNYTIPTNKIRMNLLKLNKYKGYQRGWNGYDGLPFSGRLIDSVMNILLNIPYSPHVSPTGRGSIQFDYSRGQNSMEIEIFEDRVDIFEVIDEQENEYTVTIDQLSTSINRFYAA